MHANILFPINCDSFTYLVPEDLQSRIKVGMRVRAPFRKGKKTGIVESTAAGLRGAEQGGAGKGLKRVELKQIEALLDDEPFIPENLLKLIRWVGQYYLSSAGLALKNAVPSAFFTGQKAGRPRITYNEPIRPKTNFQLTNEQRCALDSINGQNNGVFLLHGVTGSGKTEVYMRAIEALPEPKKAIVLVPEIAITAQMISRFRSHFYDDVMFYHSGLSMGERIALWKNIRDGGVRVVIGVRSAVFAPFKNELGLIIVDEEQEASYKQFDGLRYNARDVALARAKLEGTKVVLGSATPSTEVFYHSRKGSFHYLPLARRVDSKPMPEVDLIDMTKEMKQTFSFSDKLLSVLKKNIDDGHQSLIMLNRRGYSPFPMCTDCGHVYKCPACSVTLIYHRDTNTLNCHYCGAHLYPKEECPNCRGTSVRYLGTGTQRVEEELRQLLPELSFERMDRDTTRKKLSHFRIVKQMEEKKIDVLLGTQMVAKGHDFPDVTVSAVVSADIALNLPDFRSAERAFQLFTQLAGRAGRGDAPGTAYIQTYEPEHPVFRYVRHHDYEGFYRTEIKARKELSYPPFSRMIRIILSFRNKDIAQRIVRNISGRIRRITSPLSSIGQGRIRDGVEILGPSPAPIEKIRNLRRWHLILKGKNSKSLRQTASMVIDKIKDIKEVRIDIDVDPINML